MAKVKTVEQLEQELGSANEKIEKLEADLAASHNDTKIQVDARVEEKDESDKKISDLETENSLLKEENESLKSEVARLLNTPDKEEKSNGVGECFEYDGKKYKLLTAAIRIPKLGKKTALEILVDTEAQAALVKSQCGMIKEIV